MADAARAAASHVIAESTDALLASMPAVRGVVALYAAKGSEVETARLDSLVRSRGVRVAYPRVVDGDRVLAFHAAAIGDLLTSHFALREPPKSPATHVPLDGISAFVIPGLAFDRTGGRLGWGRGHYDASLALAPHAVRIGLAFECQLVDEIAREPHDVGLHYLVTESTIYRAAD